MRRTSLAVSFLLSLPFALTACGGGLQGSTYQSAREFDAATADWIVIGRFDLQWPATVTTVEEGQDKLRFRRGPTPHEYSGYAGYRLRAVHLDHDGREGIIVLRSKEKVPAVEGTSTPAAPR